MSKPVIPAPVNLQNNENSSRLGATDLFMLLAVLLWAVNFSVVKIALREFTPGGFNGPRLTIASLLLLVYLRRKEGRIPLSRKDVARVVILGIVGNTFYQSLFINGIHRTSASTTSLVMTMTPIFIALLSALFIRERIHWVGWVGILMSFFGLSLVLFGDLPKFSGGEESLKGNLMILAGNLFWAVYTVFSKPLLNRMSPLRLTTVTLSIGTLFYLPLTVKEVASLSWGSLSTASWAALLFSAVFAIAVSYVIWYSSVKRVGNTKTGIYGNITPVFTVFFAYLFLGENVGPIQVIGTLIIFLGFYLTRFGYRWFQKTKEGVRA
ncbi:MAG TPA: DMT family transporter [Candidatus Desulfaltia sp.]|nr:DMT family transporter [Candidatus Desulfaltia sp.]